MKKIDVSTVPAGGGSIDMVAEPGVEAYSHRDGSLYPVKAR
jgi:hypothetical protein